MARSKTLGADVTRTHVVVLEAGDSVIDALIDFSGDRQVRSASFTGIGAFSRSTLAFFDVKTKQYQEIPVDEQTEVLSLIGDIVQRDDGGWQIHAHVVLGLRDGATRGGHLRAATVLPTLELVVTESPQQLRRRYDPDCGLALIDLGSEPAFEGDPLRYGLAPANRHTP